MDLAVSLPFHPRKALAALLGLRCLPLTPVWGPPRSRSWMSLDALHRPGRKGAAGVLESSAPEVAVWGTVSHNQLADTHPGGEAWRSPSGWPWGASDHGGCMARGPDTRSLRCPFGVLPGRRCQEARGRPWGSRSQWGLHESGPPALQPTCRSPSAQRCSCHLLRPRLTLEPERGPSCAFPRAARFLVREERVLWLLLGHGQLLPRSAPHGPARDHQTPLGAPAWRLLAQTLQKPPTRC